MTIWRVKITVEYEVTADSPDAAIDRAYDYLDSEPNARAQFDDVTEQDASSDINEITEDT